MKYDIIVRGGNQEEQITVTLRKQRFAETKALRLGLAEARKKWPRADIWIAKVVNGDYSMIEKRGNA